MSSTTKFQYAGPGANPSPDTRRIYGWAGLGSSTDTAQFLVENEDQEPHTITLRNRKRQVLEGLMQSPIFAASYCRLSDQVLPLRRDYGVEITCTIYRNDPETDRELYGVYELASKVRRIGGGGK